MGVVRIFIMVARCSKCDFWNLGIIWHRNMWTKKIGRKFFVEKKSEHFWSKKNWSKNPIEKKSIFFWSTNFSIEKNLEKQIDFFSIENVLTKHFRIVFRSDFSTKHFSTHFVGKLFDEKKSTKMFSDHLYRWQMISRFRKSYLEQRASIIKIRTARTKKMSFFFHLFSLRPRPGRTRFVNLLYNINFMERVQKHEAIHLESLNNTGVLEIDAPP